MEAAGHHFTNSHMPEGSLQIVTTKPLFVTLTKPSVFPGVTEKKVMIFSYIGRFFCGHNAMFSDKKRFWYFSGSHSGAGDDQRTVRRFVVSLGEQFPTFQRHLMHQYSWHSIPQRVEPRSFETSGTTETTVLRNMPRSYNVHESVFYTLSCDLEL
jgi:hypothetical protein